jgi:hypothetical protein
MRLVKFQCTNNEVTAIAALEEGYEQLRAIEQALSWGESVGLKLEGDVYIAQDVPMPPEFVLPVECFFFGYCKAGRNHESSSGSEGQ